MRTAQTNTKISRLADEQTSSQAVNRPAVLAPSATLHAVEEYLGYYPYVPRPQSTTVPTNISALVPLFRTEELFEAL